MATRTSKTASNTPARRVGRPTNAERQQNVASQQSQLIDMAVAAASAAIKSVMGIDGGVQTIGVPQGTQSQSASTGTASTPQTGGNQTGGNQNAIGTASTSTATKSGGSRVRQAPGRRVDAESKMSLTKVFYDENLNAPTPLNRADFVRAAAEKFGYSVQTANTYVSNIEKVGGYKLERRGGNTAARGGRSRGNGNGNGQKSANAA